MAGEMVGVQDESTLSQDACVTWALCHTRCLPQGVDELARLQHVSLPFTIMESLVQSLSSLCIYAAVQFVDEPQRSALGPILLGAWEGASMYYVAHTEPTFQSALPYMVYGLRLLLYFHLSEDAIGVGLMVLWTALGILFSEALSRKHWYDTTKEKKKGRRRTVHVDYPSEEPREERVDAVERQRAPRPHHRPADVVPKTAPPVPRTRHVVRSPPTPPPINIVIAPPRTNQAEEPIDVPRIRRNTLRPILPTPQHNASTISSVISHAYPPSEPSNHLPSPVLPEPPLLHTPKAGYSHISDRDSPSSHEAELAEYGAPLSPISLSFSHAADNISTPAPEYSVSVPSFLQYPRYSQPRPPSIPPSSAPPPISRSTSDQRPPSVQPMVLGSPVAIHPRFTQSRPTSNPPSSAFSTPPVVLPPSMPYQRPPSVQPATHPPPPPPIVEEEQDELPLPLMMPHPHAIPERTGSIPPLSAIEGFFPFPGAGEVETRPPSAQPMLFRPPTIIEASVEEVLPPSPIRTTPPDSPVYLPDESDPLQTPFGDNIRLPSSSRRSRQIDDDPLMTPRSSEASLSSDEEGAQFPSIASRMFADENASAIPIPIPLPSSSRVPTTIQEETAASTPTVTSAITSPDSPGLSNHAQQLRRDAWDEEARRRTLHQDRAQALKNGDQGRAFMLLGEIESSSEKIKKLHERAEKRHYHGKVHILGRL